MTLKLYSFATANGQKITLFLQLLGLKYDYQMIDIRINVQKEPWFLKLNPNGRIPVITDTDAEGHQTTLAESGAILQYLGEKYDTERKYYHDLSSKYYWDQTMWLTFQVASHSPIQGQATHFWKLATVDYPYGKKRFMDETKLVYGVYEMRLKENNGWMVGDHLNIADIAAYPLIKKAEVLNVDLAAEFPLLKEWMEKIDKIAGVEEGMSVF